MYDLVQRVFQFCAIKDSSSSAYRLKNNKTFRLLRFVDAFSRCLVIFFTSFLTIVHIFLRYSVFEQHVSVTIFLIIILIFYTKRFSYPWNNTKIVFGKCMLYPRSGAL